MIEPSFHPDLYRRNGFRVTALPVDATSRMMRRRRQETSLDIAATGHHPLPLDRPPTPTELNEAFARLEDPRSRIVDELLWVWAPSDGSLPHGVSAATARAHDDAVLAHCRALDLESTAQAGRLTDAQRRERDESWTTAMRRWRTVLADDDVWQHLHRRRAEMADARLSGRDVDRLRTGFPDALLTVSAELAVSATDGDDGAPARHRKLMTELADTPDVDRVLRNAASGLVGQIDEAIATARNDGRSDAATAHRLIERTARPIATLQSLLSRGDSLLNRTQDAVAVEIRQVAITIVNATQKTQPPDLRQIAAVVKSAEELLSVARSLATSASEQAAIDRDLVACKQARDVLAPFTGGAATTRPSPARPAPRTPSPPRTTPARPAAPRPAAPRPAAARPAASRPAPARSSTPAARPPKAAGRPGAVRRFGAVAGGVVAAVSALTDAWGTWSPLGLAGVAGYLLLIFAGGSAARLSRSPRRGEAFTMLGAAAVLVLTLAPYPTLFAVALAVGAGFVYAPAASAPLVARVLSLYLGGIACLLVSTIWLGSTWFGALGVLVFASGWALATVAGFTELRGGVGLGVIGLVSLAAWIWWGGGLAFLLAGVVLLVGGGVLASEEALVPARSRAVVIALLGVAGFVVGLVLGVWWLWVPGALLTSGAGVAAARIRY